MAYCVFSSQRTGPGDEVEKPGPLSLLTDSFIKYLLFIFGCVSTSVSRWQNSGCDVHSVVTNAYRY